MKPDADNPLISLDGVDVPVQNPERFGTLRKKIVLVAYHLDEIAPSITHVIVLSDGKIIAQG